MRARREAGIRRGRWTAPRLCPHSLALIRCGFRRAPGSGSAQTAAAERGRGARPGPGHGDLGALQRPEPGQGAAPQGRAVRLRPGRGCAAEERSERPHPVEPAAVGGSPQLGPQTAALGQLGGGAAGGPESDPPVGPGPALLPHPRAPQQGLVPGLRQPPLGRQGRARPRAGPGEVEPKVLQVLSLCPPAQPEPRCLRDQDPDGVQWEESQRAWGWAPAAGWQQPAAAVPEAAAAAPPAAAGAAAQPPPAAGPAEELLRPLHPPGQAGAVQDQPWLRGALWPHLLPALHPLHPAPLAQAQALKESSSGPAAASGLPQEDLQELPSGLGQDQEASWQLPSTLWLL